MFIKRALIDETGEFDAGAFPRGYGEENDFCMRARGKGWRHVLAADTFVFHEGGVSFGDTRDHARKEGIRRVRELHPSYLPEVRAVIEADPVKPVRRRVDALRLPVYECRAGWVHGE